MLLLPLRNDIKNGETGIRCPPVASREAKPLAAHFGSDLRLAYRTLLVVAFSEAHFESRRNLN